MTLKQVITNTILAMQVEFDEEQAFALDTDLSICPWSGKECVDLDRSCAGCEGQKF